MYQLRLVSCWLEGVCVSVEISKLLVEGVCVSVEISKLLVGRGMCIS